MRPLRTRIAVAHQTAQALEAASDAEWRLLDRYLATFRDRPRPMPRWLALRSDTWWRLVQAGNRARDRFGALVCQEVAEAGSFSSSEGGPVVRRVDGGSPREDVFGQPAPFSPPLLGELPGLPNMHRSPIRDDGPPPDRRTGGRLVPPPIEDTGLHGQGTPACEAGPVSPPSPLAELDLCPPGDSCQLCAFLEARVLGRRVVA